MSVSILETLMSADINLKNGGFGFMFAKNQLHNAVVLLSKGYSIGDQVEPLLEGYDNVEDVPEKEGK